MKTMKMQLAETLNASHTPLPLQVVRVVWEHLPLILFADLALCLAVLPAAAVWIVGLPILAPTVAALTLGPVWAATSAIANSFVAGETVAWGDFLIAIRRHWRAAVGLSVVPALIATLFMGTWRILASHPHMSWLYLPLFVDGCTATLVVLASLSAFSLATSRSLSGWTLWKVSLAITTLRLGRSLGILALFTVLGLFLLVFNAGLVPLLFAPLAVCLAALTRQTSESLAIPKKSVQDVSRV